MPYACAGTAGSVGLHVAKTWIRLRTVPGSRELHPRLLSIATTPSDTCRNRPLLDCAQVVNISCWIPHCTDSWRYDGVWGKWLVQCGFFTHPFEKLAKDASSLSLIQPFSALDVRAQVAAVGVLHHEVNPLGALGLDKAVIRSGHRTSLFVYDESDNVLSSRRGVLEGCTKEHLRWRTGLKVPIELSGVVHFRFSGRRPSHSLVMCRKAPDSLRQLPMK